MEVFGKCSALGRGVVPGCLEVPSHDGCGMRVLCCEYRDVGADVGVFRDRGRVVSSREVGADEKDGCVSGGSDEDRGNAM